MAVRASDFCSLAAGPSLAGWSLGDRSDSGDMTGKRGLSRARSSSSGVGGAGGATSRDADCREEPMSAVSIPVPAGISKSGASPFSNYRSDGVCKAVIGPFPRAMVGRNGAANRVAL
jgi:hypothetical protein